jgi:hypothetical protein
MKRWQTYAAILCVFVSGILVGTAGTILTLRRRAEHISRWGPPEMRLMAVRTLREHLGLDDTQRRKLGRLLTTVQRDLYSLHLTRQREAEALFAKAETEIREILTPEQAERLERLTEAGPMRFMPHRRLQGRRGGGPEAPGPWGGGGGRGPWWQPEPEPPQPGIQPPPPPP